MISDIEINVLPERRRYTKRPPARPCAVCGVICEDKAAKFCSRNCYLSQHGKKPRPCETCGKSFVPKGGHNAGRACGRVCGFALRSKMQRDAARKLACNHPPAPMSCEMCGETFLPTLRKSINVCRKSVCLAARRYRIKNGLPIVSPEKQCVCGVMFSRAFGEYGPKDACSWKCEKRRPSIRLIDYFVRGRLCRDTRLSAKDIPQGFVELKRAQLTLYREVKGKPISPNHTQ